MASQPALVCNPNCMIVSGLCLDFRMSLDKFKKIIIALSVRSFTTDNVIHDTNAVNMT